MGRTQEELLRDMQERIEAARKRRNAERSRAYYAAHKEEIRAKNRGKYAKNAERER